MRTFYLEVQMENDAFVGPRVNEELRRILSDVARRAWRLGPPEDGTPWPVLDSNGNNVGAAYLRTEPIRVRVYQDGILMSAHVTLNEPPALVGFGVLLED